MLDPIGLRAQLSTRKDEDRGESLPRPAAATPTAASTRDSSGSMVVEAADRVVLEQELSEQGHGEVNLASPW